jgi:hypothetical protein
MALFFEKLSNRFNMASRVLELLNVLYSGYIRPVRSLVIAAIPVLARIRYSFD